MKKIKNQINDEISLFDELIDSLPEGQLTDTQNTIATLNIIGNLNSQIDIIEDKLSWSVRNSILDALAKVRTAFAWIKNLLKSLSVHLWQLLSQLTTPKEWSIQGEAGVNLFGLSKNIQIKITFGS